MQAPGVPWDSFIQARQALAAGHGDQAAQLWQAVAAMADVESRHVLQAWTFLRAAGVRPGAELAKVVLGVVACVHVRDGHDVLATYRDGSVRYVNFSGAAVVLDPQLPASVAGPAREMLERGRELADQIGPWTEPGLPALPAGAARLMALTPSGPHFGQGPYDVLSTDPRARPFLDTALALLQAVISISQPPPHS
jgi:hypothetical protein